MITEEQKRVFAYLLAEGDTRAMAYKQLKPKAMDSTARVNGIKLSKDPQIKRWIIDFQNKKAILLMRNKRQHLYEQQQIADARVEDMLDENGDPLPFDQIPRHVQACIDVIYQEVKTKNKIKISGDDAKQIELFEKKPEYRRQIKFNASIPLQARKTLDMHYGLKENATETKNNIHIHSTPEIE
ncbi:MAG: hypothetical protein OEY79_00115 [Anaplasmataceae bacterium]|nr:hypothetical protein [Anaplasmataceae bacterium]